MLVGVCTHLGCIPKGQGIGDVQGRLRRLVLPVPRLALRHVRPHPAGPAPKNLEVPPYAFTDDKKTKIKIG